MKNSCRWFQRHFYSIALLAIPLSAGALSGATPLDTNLIVNGGAEASPGAGNYVDIAPPTGWTTTANFSVVRYDATSSNASPMTPAVSAQLGGGANFFAGGPNNADSSASQVIDISDRAADIDAGKLTAALSGSFGGVYNQDDAMTLTGVFRNAQGQQYAVTSIGNVRIPDRYNTPGYANNGAFTGLVYRSRNQPIPIGTRSILVTLRATRADTRDDTYNDGYADNVSLQLINTANVDTWAQSYGVASPTTDFYYGEGTDYTQGIAAMPDGGVVVVGQLSTQTGSTTNHTETLADTALIRYGQDGKILWTKKFGAKGGVGTDPSFVVTDAQGNVYFASGFKNPDNGILFPFVAKFDLNGVQQWFTNVKVPVRDIPGTSNTYDDYVNGPFTGLTLAPNGNLVLGTGLNTFGSNPLTIPGIIFVNGANGNASCIGLNTNPAASGGAAVVVPSLVTPDRYLVEANTPDYGHLEQIVLIDGTGKTLATRAPVGTQNAYFDHLIPTVDGGYMLMQTGGGGGTPTIIHKFRADLSVEFEKWTYDSFSGRSIVQTADGGYLIGAEGSDVSTSTTSPFYGKPKAFLVKLTPQGNLDRAYALGGKGDEARLQYDTQPATSNCAVVATADGGYALATGTSSYTGDTSGKPDWWIAKADKLGRIPNFQDAMDNITNQIRFGDYNNTQPPHDGIGFNDPKPYALENPAQPVGPNAVPQSLSSTDANATRRVQADAPFPQLPPPPHGGVGGTDFTVNGAHTAVTQDLHDQVIRFAAGQTSKAADLSVKVQSASDPNGTWTDLPTGRGLMTFDSLSNQYILSTTNYPTLSPTYFRAVSSAGAYPFSISNVVGPFNLASTRPHLGPTNFIGSANGLVANLRFGVTEMNIPAGVPVEVTIQSSLTPANESSWADIANGSLTPDPAAPNQYYGGLDEYPPGESIYFRAIASASPSSGYVSSISPAIGPVTVINDPPATFKPFIITPVGGTVSGGDGSTIDAPVVVSSRSFKVTATVNSPAGGRQIKKLSLEYDGDVVDSFNGSSESGNTVLYTTNIPGDHLIEAIATDDLGVVGDASPLHLRVAPLAPGLIYTLVQSGGDWSTAANWRDPNGNSGIPGPRDFAVLSNKSVSLSQDVTVNAVSLNGGVISGPRALTITGFFTVASGQVKNDLTIAAGATYELINDLDVGMGGNVTNKGTLKLHGRGGIAGIQPATSSTAAQSSGGSNTQGFNPFAGVVAFVQNVGNFVFQRPAGGRNGSNKIPPPLRSDPVLPDTRPVFVSIIAQGGGNIIAQGGGNIIAQGGGNLLAKNNAKIIAQGGGNLIKQGLAGIIASGGGNAVAKGGGAIIAQGGGNIIAQGGGNIIAAGGGNLKGSGGVVQFKPAGSQASSNTAHAATAASGLIQSGGEVDLSEITIIGPVDLEGGVLSGSGVIFGDLTNNGGYIAPGPSAGLMEVSGNLAQGANGTLIVENGGPYPDQFDQLQVGGNASLGGKLDVKLINGYAPDPLDTFSPLGYGSVAGSFASVSSNGQASVNSSGLLLSVNPNQPGPTTGQPVNISTRLQVQTGDNVLFAGFIVTGPPGSTKKIIIRGLGPSLQGVSGVLSDPLLVLNNADGSTTTNDNWKDGDTSQIPAGFGPSSDQESVIVANLTVGSGGYSSYTAVLKGAHDETGVGLLEVYDLETSSPAKLANIATRGVVQTGDNVLIGGFIIDGTEPAKVLVRATGPSSGVDGALSDPTLEIHDSNGGTVGNNNWRESQESEIAATGIAPSDAREPAIIETLVPGGYTAVVRGLNDTTGIAVVEAYNLQ